MTELFEKYTIGELEKAEVPDYKLRIDYENSCECCGGYVLVGEYEAMGICSDCYWTALGATDDL